MASNAHRSPEQTSAVDVSHTPYTKVTTPPKRVTRQETFNSDAETGSIGSIAAKTHCGDEGGQEERRRRRSSSVRDRRGTYGRDGRVGEATWEADNDTAVDISRTDDVGPRHEAPARKDTNPSSKEGVTECPMQMGSAPRNNSELSSLPRRYLNGQFQSNSYFSRRLLRLSQLIVVGDIVALGFFYFYKAGDGQGGLRGKLYVGSPLQVLVSSNETSCSTSLALAALVYHLFPAVFIIGLPASGLRVFEPFRREQRFDRGGRLQKVKRTICFQLCELVGAWIFVYEALILGYFVYYVASGHIFINCDPDVKAYVFCGGALIMFWLLFVLMRAFARFREHLKMQLGAFKESDQTGDVKAHMLRSKMKRKQRQQQKNSNDAEASPLTPTKSVVVKDVRKRLYRGAQLGDLRLIRRSIRIAKLHLGENFAKELYPDPVMVFGIFGLAKKNPMHVAAYQGNIAAMELLFKARFQVNSFDKVSRVRFTTGDLFLYLASYFIQKPVVSADETYSSVFKTTLVTPLHCAVSTGRLAAVRWLVAHGADVNLCSKSSYRSESRLPPIFLADHPEIVHVLLRAGANHLAIPDPGHMNTITVLQLAYLRGNYAAAQILEDWGGDVALTPLHAAAAMGDVATIRALLRKKVNPDVLGELGYVGLNKRTPLHWAAINGAVDAVEILLAAKADANFQDAHGRTALHWAARVNRVDIVRVLLAHGGDPTIVDDGDMTPIMCAACAGGTTADMFKALVTSGGDINHQLHSTGDTALHLAVKLDDQQTALALLSMGGDIMRTNHNGFRPIDCTTSTRLQFEIKRAAGTRDVMISYTHSHKEFALKLRKSLEDASITVWLDLMDPSGIGGGSVWREEIARGITNAAVVLCILTEDYASSEWCLKELALAKQVGIPIMAISTEHATISEELQVYLYTRQLVPFEVAIVHVKQVTEKEIRYEYDDGVYKNQLRMLLDGMRDEIEKRKEENIKRNMRRAETNLTLGSGHGGSGMRSRRIYRAASQMSYTYTNSMGSIKFDERAPTAAPFDMPGYYANDSYSSPIHEVDDGSAMPVMVGNSRRRGAPGSAHSIGSNGVFSTGQRSPWLSNAYDYTSTNMSILSSTSSSNSFVDDCGVSDSIVLDTGGYYFHQAPGSEKHKQGSRNNAILTETDGLDASDSIVEDLQELNTATASGEQFVFISHGDHHQRFVQKLCVEMCREGGLRCYVDRKHIVELSTTIAEDKEEELEKKKSMRLILPRNEDMSMRIHDAKEAILRCSAFVVLVSEKTLASELVKDQLAFAEDKGKNILPVVVNHMDFGLDIKYSLARSTFFHFFTKGDMMGFRQSLRHLLDALREEVYGIGVEGPLRSVKSGTRPSRFKHGEHQYPRLYGGGHASSFSGGGHGNGRDVQPRGGFSTLGDSFTSAFGSYNPPVLNEVSLRMRPPTSDSLYCTSSRSDIRNYGLPSTRLSQTFAETNGATRSRTSDMSLALSMVGNFSTLVGRITDDVEEEDEVLSYGGMQDDEFDLIDEVEDEENREAPHVVEAVSLFSSTLQQQRAGDGISDTRQRGSDSSISMLEVTEPPVGVDITVLGDE